jgi:hypothetical protein
MTEFEEITEIKEITNNAEEKEPVRCSKCDSIVEHYNTFISPTNETTNVCWECLAREEKGFNAKPHFFRRSRLGVIPR